MMTRCLRAIVPPAIASGVKSLEDVPRGAGEVGIFATISNETRTNNCCKYQGTMNRGEEKKDKREVYGEEGMIVRSVKQVGTRIRKRDATSDETVRSGIRSLYVSLYQSDGSP